MGVDKGEARPPGWNAIHDCDPSPGPRVWLRQTGNISRTSAGAGLYGCGCPPSSPHERRTAARGCNHDGDRCTRGLRTSAAALVNQLVEAQREQSLSRMLARWSRVELIVIDELGYVPLAEVAAEL